MRKLCCLFLLLLLVLTGCSQTTPPAAEPPSSEPETPPAERDQITSVYPWTEAYAEHDGRYISLMILADSWDYECLPYNEGSFGIAFWPKTHPDARVEVRCYDYPFGVCGTGLETQPLELTNGITASMGTYSGDFNNWSHIWFGPEHGNYAALSDGAAVWWETRGTEALEILSSAVLGTTTTEVNVCESEKP